MFLRHHAAAEVTNFRRHAEEAVHLFVHSGVPRISPEDPKLPRVTTTTDYELEEWSKEWKGPADGATGGLQVRRTFVVLDIKVVRKTTS